MVEKNVGDTVRILFSIQNTGGVDHSFPVRAYINGTVIGEGTVSIPAGATANGEFSFIATTAGTFDVKLEVLDGGAVLDSRVLPRELVVKEVPVVSAVITAIEVR